jgi:hypothetical protein
MLPCPPCTACASRPACSTQLYYAQALLVCLHSLCILPCMYHFVMRQGCMQASAAEVGHTVSSGMQCTHANASALLLFAVYCSQSMLCHPQRCSSSTTCPSQEHRKHLVPHAHSSSTSSSNNSSSSSGHLWACRCHHLRKGCMCLHQLLKHDVASAIISCIGSTWHKISVNPLCKLSLSYQ